MIKIERLPCPPSLKDKSEEGNYYNTREVVETLWKMQHGKCCYCEMDLPEKGHLKAVEHFKPKAVFKGLRNDWKNLLLACAQCNGKKSNKFPVILSDENNVESVLYIVDERDETPAIIDPSKIDPEPHLAYELDLDRIHKSFVNIRGKSVLGRETIATVGLTDAFYLKARRRWYWRVLMPSLARLSEAELDGSEREKQTQRKDFAALLADKEIHGGLSRAFARHHGVIDLVSKPAAPKPKPRQVKPRQPKGPINPFTNTAAIHDPAQFIGREKMLRRLSNSLNGGCVALIGEPKIGKSSILLRLKEAWRGDTVVPIDFSGLTGRDHFYSKLAVNLGLKADASEEEIGDAFEERRLLLLLDEIEAAPVKGIREEDMSWLRAKCNSHPNVSAVISGQRQLCDIFGDSAGSAWDNIFIPKQVKYLTRAEAETLLEHPWAPDEMPLVPNTIREILDKTGLHPYRIQRGGYHAFEALHDPDYDWRAELQQELENCNMQWRPVGEG
ncbi:MAG: AAA family ATPase [Acidobacteriota bacterium]|nr:AAA family ATPase [Acidobacteriota bacterium]